MLLCATLPAIRNTNTSHQPPPLPRVIPKPNNVFYVWYPELCRRLNGSAPSPLVKSVTKIKSKTVLDFNGDRLKTDDWNPVLGALRQDNSLHVIAIRSRLNNTKCLFQHELDTEEKLRQSKKRCVTLWTAFIMHSLLKTLSTTIRGTQVLSCLVLDGLPMFEKYLEPLLKSLATNKTLRTLSLSRCRIHDSGCQLVCNYVRYAPNIEVLDLTSCALSAESGKYLAELIKYQQINRYCESWHQSLRYSDPGVQKMRGLKRLTLNLNTEFGDAGLAQVIRELDDDLWIKALDCQRCGITDKSSASIVDLIELSQSLEILDFRMNEHLSTSTIQRVLSILEQKQQFDGRAEPEFQWCGTMCSLLPTECGDSTFNSVSTLTSKNSSIVRKAKSMPLKTGANGNLNQVSGTGCTSFVRKSHTSDCVNKKKKNESVEKKVRELSVQLKEEIVRRIEMEKKNEKLMQELNEIRSANSILNNNKNSDNEQKSKRSILPKVLIKCETTKNTQSTTPIKVCGFGDGIVDGFGDTVNNVFNNNNPTLKNGFKHPILNGTNNATDILKKLMGNEEVDEKKETDRAMLINYVKSMNQQRCKSSDESHISLLKYMTSELEENKKNSRDKSIARVTSNCYKTNNNRVKKK